ncbi:hypothetical protein ABI59_16715 [Acidobacteria bacterium Mor1]|nr:hypothetical protein ABI59_16715 [Acidobacteria bacterium Mor1]
MKQPFDDVLGAVARTVDSTERDGKEMRIVRLARTYATDTADLWHAVTDAERLSRWFAPVSGEFGAGGTFQIEGNASGKILACEPPANGAQQARLAITWEFAGSVTWVDVALAAAEGGHATLTLEHTLPADAHWKQYGPGATGTGWDLGFVGLGVHLGSDDGRFAEETWMATDEGKDFLRASSHDWGRADEAFGTDAETARAQAGRTAAFYTGEAAPK